MTVQDIVSLIMQEERKLKEEEKELREITYTGFELSSHVKDAQRLFEISGALKELHQLRFKIALEQNK